MTPNEGTGGGGGIGKRLQAARELGGISAHELERLAGVSYAYVSQIERGEKVPGSAMSSRFATVLGLSLDWLIKGSGSLPSERAVKSAINRRRSIARS